MRCSKLVQVRHTRALRAGGLQMVARITSILCVALLLLVYPAKQSHAVPGVFVQAGDLAVDVRAKDLNPNSNVWLNRAIGPNSVGSFSTRAGNVNVASIGLVDGLPQPALFVNNTGANSLVSALTAPAALLGTSSGSSEAWVYNPAAFEPDETIVAWGVNNNSGTAYRGFRYAAPGNFNSGMFSSWFQDENWDEPTDLIGDQWVHIAWTYEPGTLKGYVNGQLATTAVVDPALNTLASGLTIGARNTGSTADAVKGYITSVRVHTGILSDANILTNFMAGPNAISTQKICDFNSDGDCDSADFNNLRDHLFTNGTFANGDINGDGTIDLKDYRLFKDDPDRVFGQVGPGGSGSLQFAVPEPASLSCLSIASVLLLAVRRARKPSH